MRNVMITGADSYIGKSLISRLESQPKDIRILAVNRNTSDETLLEYASLAHFVFHLEEIIQAKNKQDYQRTNIDYTNKLIQYLRKSRLKAPIVFLSSQQALARNEYGYSKFIAEQILMSYAQVFHIPVCIYRLPEIFGESAPIDQSTIATYCYNILHEIPIYNEKPDEILKFVNIFDVLEEFERALRGFPNLATDSCFAKVPKLYSIARKELINKIMSFFEGRATNYMPSLIGNFDHQLYLTFQTYIDASRLKCPLKKVKVNDGYFYDFMNSQDVGHFRIFHLPIGCSYKAHWHEKKSQKIIIISGTLKVTTRKRSTGERKAFEMNENRPSIIDIPPNVVHSIKNAGESDASFIVWSSNAMIDTKF